MKFLFVFIQYLLKKMIKMLTFKPMCQIGLIQDFLTQFPMMNTDRLLINPYVNGVKLGEQNLL